MTATDPEAQESVLSRVRPLVEGRGAVREVAMFGGRAVMLDDRMVVSVGKDGSLLVRTDPARHDELLARPGARQAVMGADRDMGPGWLTVDADALDDDAVASWLDVALQLHSASG